MLLFPGSIFQCCQSCTASPASAAAFPALGGHHAALVNNITSSERLIRTLQDQLKSLQKNYGKLQQDVLQFQKNQTNLERKFSYDLSQCINQMKEVKEQCEERIEEVTRKSIASRELNEKKDQQLQAPSETPPRLQEAGPAQGEMPQAKGKELGNGELQTPAPSSEVAVGLKRTGMEETNEIQVISKEETQRDSLGLPPEPSQGQAETEERQVDRRGIGEAGDPGQTPQAPVTLLASQNNEEMEDPERDQLIIRDGHEEPEADEEGRNQKKVEDDYNMDENEAESETDKQAALAWNDKSLNVLSAENKERNINLLDQHEKRNHTI
ncbi:Golgi membrane protein 1 isoform X1 [Sorex araneus]|uniref:Golgi membrane protein 1 isoform X1 n=1 Tax=Sorex araneus TaxID=42254 RepID=UPI002433CA0D|nr:Golgi membrane protein 1 isoform X1 [Sorex araneus]